MPESMDERIAREKREKYEADGGGPDGRAERRLATIAQRLRPTPSSASAPAPSVALLGLPSDLNSTYLQGPAQAPPLLRQAIACDSANSYAELGDSFTELVSDHGDVALSPTVTPHDADAALETAVAKSLGSGLAPLLIGGDHSVTYPAVRALAAHCRSALQPASLRDLPLAIVHFDAHPDLYDEVGSFMPTDNRFSHASPFARIMESGDCATLCQLGCRTLNPHQRAQRERFGVQALDAARWPDTRAELWEWLDAALPQRCLIHVTVDIDAIDPAFAPGVSHFEPGGLSVRNILDVIHALVPPPPPPRQSPRQPPPVMGIIDDIPRPDWPGRERYVVGADVVEYNAVRDFGGSTSGDGSGEPGMTAMVGAKLLKELAAVLHRARIAMAAAATKTTTATTTT